MKKTRKALSLTLAMAMLFSLMATGAAAADDTLTRGEMAALLVEEAGLSNQVERYAARPSSFRDVAEGSPYEGHINLAYEKGFISGTGNGMFSPDKAVTELEVGAMALRLAGVPGVALTQWPSSYDRAIISTGLAKDLNYESAGKASEAFAEKLLDHATAIKDKPFIGISWKNDNQDYSNFHKIIALSGGAALEMPQIKNRADADAVTRAVDGLIVTGGEDINPDLYNEPHSPLLEDNNAHRDVRDTSDYNLIQSALAEDLPMLAICRGMQMFNVACGGGLIQDLPTYLDRDGETYVTHRYRASGDYARHGITVLDNSKWLSDIIGGTELENVASWHHQALNPDRIGKNITVVAYGPENVIEAIEYQDNTFAMGVQFHPERDALGEDSKCDVPTCLHFFETLVDFASDKPVIGISWGGDPQDAIDMHRIVRKAGGVTTRMPQITDLESAMAATGKVDGLIVTGGEDINPDLYNEPHSPLLEDNTEHRDLRDTSDYNLIKAAVKGDVPMLAICRGMQMFNVVQGGGLIQDLPTYLNTDGDTYRVHRNRPEWARHDITLEDSAKFMKEIVGAGTMADVASWHHQALNPARMGEGLTITAYGPDAVIEAVEYQANEFSLGVQFHPEADAMEKAEFMNYFNILVKYASN